MIQRVSEATGLTATGESSFFGSILKVFSAEISILYDELIFAESQSHLSTAVGNALNSIGEFYGVIRKPVVASSTVGGPYSVVFTNNTGSTVSVPARTRIWSSANPQLAYTVVFATSIAAGQQGYVDVQAVAPGEFYNTGANQLDTTNLGISNVTVTKELPISTGSDLESDANYRVRIQQEIYRKEGANLTAIRSYLLEVPGVRDVQINNLARGTGTFDALIYGYDRVVPQAVINACQAVLDLNVSAGVSALAKAPVVKYIDVSVKLKIKPSAVFANVQAVVISSVRSYLDNLEIEKGNGNGTIYYQELASRVQESTSDIIDSSVTMIIDGVPALRSNQTTESGSRFVSRVISVK